MEKITYPELKDTLYNYTAANPGAEPIKGVIVFAPESFNKEYSLESRSYVVSSDNKAYTPNMAGYSIFGSSLDESDIYVRLDHYMALECGGKDGWIVDYCYLLEKA